MKKINSPNIKTHKKHNQNFFPGRLILLAESGEAFLSLVMK